VCILKPTRRGRTLQKGHFSLHGPILRTRSMWQFWALETLQKRLSNASVTLQKRSISGLHVLLDVFIHCGRFHGQGARRCGALLARVRVRLAAACATTNPGFISGGKSESGRNLARRQKRSRNGRAKGRTRVATLTNIAYRDLSPILETPCLKKNHMKNIPPQKNMGGDTLGGEENPPL
jgi:hypothetical protein